jgi:hypothetical protein
LWIVKKKKKYQKKEKLYNNNCKVILGHDNQLPPALAGGFG